VDAAELYAVFNGKPLADSELLSLAGVEEEQTLYILGRLLGGGKKRKKKTYTKPKKQKHKHKKIKLRVLKFYKVGFWFVIVPEFLLTHTSLLDHEACVLWCGA
jgi:small subunit ribosomal protein S27Ae